MRIEAVKAVAFGPLSGETLELAPGMNVIYGPNESGKSSWHAAIYAALCGMKRTRGQPTREDKAFAAKHRPWQGTTWRVKAVVSLDDGRTVEIEQGFDPAGRSVAIDRRTKQRLGDDIVRAGAVDAATLLGLTRETALATLFVRQADMLRVLTDASALQEYLERAAATSAFDTTADEALTLIAEYKRDRVGVLRVGARGPLATVSKELDEARMALDAAEERYESYQQLLARKRTAEIEVAGAEDRLREVLNHEREREHRERWQEMRAAERRLDQARELKEQASSGPLNGGAARDVLAAVTRALAAFEARPDEPAPLDGPTAEMLNRQLADLPTTPEGDLEPAAEVTACLDTWRRETQRLMAHKETEPLVGQDAALPALPSELRRLADELELPLPAIDESLIHDVQRRRSTAPPRQPEPPIPAGASSMRAGGVRPAIAIGGSLAVAGIALAALDHAVAAAAVLILAVVVGAVAALRVRMPAAHGAQLQARAAPAMPDPELTRLEARLAIQEETRAQALRRHDGALARIADLGLPLEAVALRQLAADGDAAASAHSRHTEWESRRTVFEQKAEVAAEALQDALSARGILIGDEPDVEKVFAQYVESCRKRAEIARQASRRPDLEGQLVSRRAAEQSRDQDIAARRAAERQLREAARQASYEVPSIDGLAKALYEWIGLQEELAEVHQQHAETAARLDQLLDGRSVEQIEDEIRDLRVRAGDPLPQGIPHLEDRSIELETRRSRVRERRDALAELVGQVEGAEKYPLDVSPAIEAEARAVAEMHRITSLAEDLEVASEILGAAQHKVHADIAPVLHATIQPWVPRITCGRYDDVRVNPATLELQAHETRGQFRPATVLSHGTTEQLFLLLRLALAQRLTTTGERAPIVLDDITVQSDAHRTVAALELLHELSAENQVVLFSQEEEVLLWSHQQLNQRCDRLVQLPAPA